MTRLVLFSTDAFADHQTPPGHPESSERADVMTLVASDWRREGGTVVAPRPATVEELGRVHDREYLELIASTKGRAVALDADTYTSAATQQVALLAAGAAVDAAGDVMAGRAARTLALVRPPGHHAERARAMGFCIYNNAAIAAAAARAGGAARVAIVDVDVHHGNGTQHVFEADPAVLYVSTHQSPAYPGTGAPDDIGEGGGAGFTVNLPMAPGAVDEDYRLVFAGIIAPVLRQFRPELIIASVGFDAHERDPLAAMRLTTAAFGAMAGELASLADELCRGRLAIVVEGGYDLDAFESSLREVVDALASDQARRWPPPSAIAPVRGQAAVAAARAALTRHWKL